MKARGFSGLEVTLSFRGPDDDGSGFKRHLEDGITPRRPGDLLAPEPRRSRTVIVAPAYPVPGEFDDAILRACQVVIGGETREDVERLTGEYQVVVDGVRALEQSIVIDVDHEALAPAAEPRGSEGGER